MPPNTPLTYHPKIDLPYPVDVAYMVGRCCASEVVLEGYTLEAGTTILISPYVIHRDPAYWVQ
eukprot:1195204-Prorocentrum_minimum.AAC.8